MINIKIISSFKYLRVYKIKARSTVNVIDFIIIKNIIISIILKGNLKKKIFIKMFKDRVN